MHHIWHQTGTETGLQCLFPLGGGEVVSISLIMIHWTVSAQFTSFEITNVFWISWWCHFLSRELTWLRGYLATVRGICQVTLFIWLTTEYDLASHLFLSAKILGWCRDYLFWFLRVVSWIICRFLTTHVVVFWLLNINISLYNRLIYLHRMRLWIAFLK